MKSTSFLKFLSGSFSSRCLIFKVQFRCLSQDSLLSISHHLRFVNTFFHLFSKFFPASLGLCDSSFSHFALPASRFRITAARKMCLILSFTTLTCQDLFCPFFDSFCISCTPARVCLVQTCFLDTISCRLFLLLFRHSISCH